MLKPYIETFFKVIECGGFSAASEQQYLSKVSVMNQINALEDYVGVPLLVRSNRGVSLTEAGQSFYRNTLRLQKLSESALTEARKIGGASPRIIRVGTSMMRPSNKLVELWEITACSDFQFHIVPFNDGIDSLNSMLKSLGSKIDCFATPCSSIKLLMNYNFLPFGTCKYQAAMSRRHKLADKTKLCWDDLNGESILLVQRGESYVVDEIRDEITKHHKGISIIDFNGYYDAETFNMCEQTGCLIGTMDLWRTLHPSLVTLPVEWNYETPYGIIYAKEPSKIVQEFTAAISQNENVKIMCNNIHQFVIC